MSIVAARAPSASRAQLGRELALARQQLDALEGQVRDLTRQRELLLQELNHRVGNHLAVLLGILDREPSTAQGLAGGGAPLRLSRYVTGLAVAHRMLSESGWQPLRLALLCRFILEAVASGLGPAVRVRVTDSTLEVPSRVADRVAIILSELTLNSLRHCRGRELLELDVRLGVSQHQLVLEYRDDGPGYPAAVLDGSAVSGGLGLVSELVRHGLKGSSRLSNDPGATTILTFPGAGSSGSDAVSEPGKQALDGAFPRGGLR